MKIILLLEPPFCSMSLDIEDVFSVKKYSYLSLSDLFMAEMGGGSAIFKEVKSQESSDPQFVFKAIVEKYLQKTPKNFPSGFVLDPDFINDREELILLLELLKKMGHQISYVIDIQESEEICKEYIDDFQVDREEGVAEIRNYFDEFYPQVIEIINQWQIPTITVAHQDESKPVIKEILQKIEQID